MDHQYWRWTPVVLWQEIGWDGESIAHGQCHPFNTEPPLDPLSIMVAHGNYIWSTWHFCDISSCSALKWIWTFPWNTEKCPNQFWNRMKHPLKGGRFQIFLAKSWITFSLAKLEIILFRFHGTFVSGPEILVWLDLFDRVKAIVVNSIIHGWFQQTRQFCQWEFVTQILWTCSQVRLQKSDSNDRDVEKRTYGTTVYFSLVCSLDFLTCCIALSPFFYLQRSFSHNVTHITAAKIPWAYILKASDVAGLAILAKKIGGKFGLKMA